MVIIKMMMVSGAKTKCEPWHQKLAPNFGMLTEQYEVHGQTVSRARDLGQEAGKSHRQKPSTFNQKTSRISQSLAIIPPLLSVQIHIMFPVSVSMMNLSSDSSQVVSFMKEIGFEQESLKKVLLRCPELFAADVDNTLRRKLGFFSGLGISISHLSRVLRKYPELLLYDVDRTLLPRSKPFPLSHIYY